METLVNITQQALCPGMHLSPECNCLLGAEKSAFPSALPKGERNGLDRHWPPLDCSSTPAVSRTAPLNLMLKGAVAYFLTLQSINTEGKTNRRWHR